MKTTYFPFQNKSRKYKAMPLILCAVLGFLLCGCSFARNSKNQSVQNTILAFDTVVTITLYGTDDTTVLTEALNLCKDYEALLSRTLPDSDVYKINHASGRPVVVSPETIFLIKESLRYSELTDGAVDITIAPVRELWNFTSQDQNASTALLPDSEDLSNALSHVDYRCIQYDETANTVTLTDPQAQIDLGFIAKGYIADSVKTYLEKNGITSAVINLGGNVLTIGEKPDGSPFRIGIEKPFATTETMDVLSVTDSSVVTSGIYERYFQIGDTIYHHILNPRTGYPISNNLLSVTILSDSSVEGDALSTSCLLLGFEDARRLIESLDGIDAVFITDDYQIYDTRK